MNKEYTEDDIQSLSGKQHVRMRPKMYFEKCFSEKSLDSLPFEVLCHAFDEYYDGNCKEIKLTFWKDHFAIEYDVGMPLRKMKYDNLTYAEVIMTKVMACSNLKKHFAVGHEFCGIGMATINFASESCELTTVWNNKKGTFVFENGETISRNIEAIKSDKSWTKIFVKPLKDIFGKLEFTSNGVNEKAKEINRRLTKLNIIIENNIA